MSELENKYDRFKREFNIDIEAIKDDAAAGGGGGGATLENYYDKDEADTLLSTKADTTALTSHTSNTSNPHSVTKSQVGLGNVDNTSDVNKPVSSAAQTALNAKADASALTSHTGNTSNPHSVTKSQVGLGNVDNTSDASKPVSTATQTALDGKQALDSDLTAIAGLTPTNDDIVQRKAGAWTNRTPSQLKTDLSLTKTDVGLANVDNTSDANKPVSSATQTALNAKAPLASPAFTGTPTGITKSHVGLGNVDNTADSAKPVSVAQQLALDGKVAKGSLVFNVADYGAVGNGSTNDAAAIGNAITAAAATGVSGTVLLTGNHVISSTIVVPSNIEIRGGANVTVIVPAAGTFPAFKLDAATNARITDVVVKKASGAAAGSGQNAVYIVGNCDSVVIRNVTAIDLHSSFYIAGQNGAVGGTAKRIVLENCRSTNAVQYGFWLDDVDGVDLNSCQSVVSGLDGIKLRKKTKNVSIVGGYFSGATGGDGLDAYAGGDTFSIVGGAFTGNSINGITVKNDDLSLSDPTNYGLVRNITITGVKTTNNGGNGLTLHRSSGNPDDPAEPLTVRGTVTGLISYGNTNYGLYLQGRQYAILGAQCSRNGLDGIYLESACLDVSLIACHAAGNSTTTTNTRDGFHINGSRIQVIGGSSIGADPDGANDDAAVAAGTKTQRYGLRIEAAATAVEVLSFNSNYNATANESDLSGAYRGNDVGATYIAAGKYVGALSGTRTTLSLAANVEYASPIWFGNSGTIVRLGAEVATTAGTAGTVLRLGIRKSTGPTHDPGAVLGETTVAGDALATVESTVSIVIPAPGLYWLTCTAQSTGAQLPTVRAAVGLIPVWNGTLASALGSATSTGYITAATVTGALPGTYTVTGRSSAPPLVVVRG